MSERRYHDADEPGTVTGVKQWDHLVLANGDDGTPDLDPDRRHFLLVDDPHTEQPPLTVQRYHKLRRWWTRELPSVKARAEVLAGPFRIYMGRPGRFARAKAALWKAVTE